MTDDLFELWERVEAHLRAVLRLVEIEPSARSEVEEFLDHNELGLAYESLVEAVEHDSADPAVRDHLAAAAREMGL